MFNINIKYISYNIIIILNIFQELWSEDIIFFCESKNISSQSTNYAVYQTQGAIVYYGSYNTAIGNNLYI
jgi:hypothetical protein